MGLDAIDNKPVPRTYSPAPAKSPFFDEMLLMIGGKNPIGEPFLRVVWGWDCRTFRNGNPNALSYPGPFLDRFILEKWLAPEIFGTPAQWEAARYIDGLNGGKVDSLGPYPRQGRYGMVMPVIAGGLPGHGTQLGDYVPCDEALLEAVALLMPQILGNTPKCYSTLDSLKLLYQQMEEDEQRHGKPDPDKAAVKEQILKETEIERGEDWDEADKFAKTFYDEVKTREDQINRNPAFSFDKSTLTVRPNSLWTPNGEHPII